MRRNTRAPRPRKPISPKLNPTHPGRTSAELADGIGGLVGPVPIDQVLRREAEHLRDIAGLANLAAEDLLYLAKRLEPGRGRP